MWLTWLNLGGPGEKSVSTNWNHLVATVPFQERSQIMGPYLDVHTDFLQRSSPRQLFGPYTEAWVHQSTSSGANLLL